MIKTTVKTLLNLKEKSEKIAMITGYDYISAYLAEKAGIHAILVGDSLGMVIKGENNTTNVTIEEIIYHSRAVSKGCSLPLIIADLPFMSYQINIEQALINASRCIQEGLAHAVKLEGGKELVPTIKKLITSGIPVFGHIGLKPQSINVTGGYQIQGQNNIEATELLDDAKALEEAGVSGIILELIPSKLAKKITESISIPTIGIGAGPYCDGQIQVWHDILGLYPNFVPKHTRQFVDLQSIINKALTNYIENVKNGQFPNDSEFIE